MNEDVAVSTLKTDFHNYDDEAILKELKKMLGKRQWDIHIKVAQTNEADVPIMVASNEDTKSAIFYLNTLNENCLDIVGYYQYTGWLFHIVRSMLGLDLLEYVPVENKKYVERHFIQIAWGITVMLKRIGLEKFLREEPIPDAEPQE